MVQLYDFCGDVPRKIKFHTQY